MLARVKRILAPPTFPDEAQTRLAAWLNTLLLTTLAVMAVYLVVSLWVQFTLFSQIFIGLLTLVQIGVLITLHRGHVRLASVLFCGSATLAMWFAVYEFGGVRSASFSALILVILSTGFLLGGRAALFLAVLNTLLGWLLLEAERAGMLPSNPVYLAPLAAWLGVVLTFVVGAVLFGLINRSFRQALRAAQDSQRILQERTQELEQERATLQHERDFVARLMETSPIGIVRLDRDGHITFANSGAEQALGLTRTQIEQRCYDSPEWHITDVHGWPLPAAQLPFALAAASGQAVYDTQLSIEHPGGQRALLSVNVAPLFNPAGQFDGVVTTVHDMTEQRLSEAVLTRRARQLQTVAELARDVASVLDLGELLPRVVESIQVGFELYYVGLFLVDVRAQCLRLRAGTGPVGQQMLQEGFQFKLDGQSMVSWSVLHRQARVTQQVGEDHIRFDNPLLPATRSELALPLLSRGQPIGSLSIQSDRPHSFTDVDISVLQAMADQVAVAIENARLFEETRQHLAEIETLHAVATAVTEVATESEMLDRALGIISQAISPAYCGAFLTDEERQGLRVYLFRAGISRLLPDDIIPLGRGITGTVAVTGHPRRIADVRSEPAYYLYNPDTLSELCVPIKVGDRILGVINVESRHLNAFDEADEQLLSTIASQLGVAVERLRAETERRDNEQRQQAIARNLRAVVEAADELIQLNDLDTLYRRAVELPREKLSIERCAIFLLNAQRESLHGTYGTDFDGHTTDETQARMMADSLAELFNSRTRPWLAHTAPRVYWKGETLHTAEPGWVVMTVIRVGAEPLGVFYNDTAITHAPVDEVRQESLAIYCSLLGNIIVRRRVAQEREVMIQELEAKNAELERFTYTVSHDLKSPLITIRGFLGLLAKDAAAGDVLRMETDMQRIAAATDKMQQLLTDLLELSRIGRLVNPPEAAPLAVLAQEAVALVEGRLNARGVTVDIAPDLPEVYVDRARVVEALQNLVDNAAKFMGAQSQPRIEIGWQPTAPPVFFVKDNGQGIAPRFHERVFGLFDKLDPHSEGTGIGLALVKRIINVQGGRIWIESAGPGTGSAFCFTLPGVTRA